MIRKQFETVKRLACKASILIEGLPGKGKSGLALLIALALASKPDRVYAVDTENKSLNLFDGIKSSAGTVFKDFKGTTLDSDDGFKPTNYLYLREQALQQGCEVFIKDSISHAWQYEGGILTMVSKLAEASSRKGDKYAPWRDPEVVKEKNALLDLMRSSKCHVISTVRLKEKFAPEVVDGKTVIKSLGEQQIMQDDIKYEPDLVLTMISPGRVRNNVVTHPVVKIYKSRYAIFAENEVYEMTPELIDQLKQYLAEGVDPEELLAKQQADYVQAIVTYLDANPAQKAVWQVLKQDNGLKDTPLKDIPLSQLKQMYSTLII